MSPNLALKCVLLLLITCSILAADDPSLHENWQGQWFPYPVGATKDINPTTEIRQNLYDDRHGVMMGVQDVHCDDGKTNLEIDWDFNPVNHTCFVFNRRVIYRARSDIQPVLSNDYIPKDYNAPHRCMSEQIDYNVLIPTYGTHRPLWAKYGEYTFLPRQRWLHNLEHGAVVMLYHPCADKNEVNVLRKLVQKCLYKHIITPYNLLSAERPLALVAWGHRFEMSKVAPELVVSFIKNYGLKGPEHTSRDGQYSLMLEQHADVVSDLDDHEVCKYYNYIQ